MSQVGMLATRLVTAAEQVWPAGRKAPVQRMHLQRAVRQHLKGDEFVAGVLNEMMFSSDWVHFLQCPTNECGQIGYRLATIAHDIYK